MAEEAGQHWRYCGGATVLIGRLLAQGTGEPLPGCARRELFEPLGISAFECMTGQDGVASPASGLRLATPDFARPVRLAGDGAAPPRADRRRLRLRIPPVHGHIPAKDGTRPVRWSAAFGNGGQHLYVLPDLDSVVVITAANYDTAEQSAIPSAIMNEAVVPTLSPVSG